MCLSISVVSKKCKLKGVISIHRYFEPPDAMVCNSMGNEYRRLPFHLVVAREPLHTPHASRLKNSTASAHMVISKSRYPNWSIFYCDTQTGFRLVPWTTMNRRKVYILLIIRLSVLGMDERTRVSHKSKSTIDHVLDRPRLRLRLRLRPSPIAIDDDDDVQLDSSSVYYLQQQGQSECTVYVCHRYSTCCCIGIYCQHSSATADFKGRRRWL